jgi:hypothetical protein
VVLDLVVQPAVQLAQPPPAHVRRGHDLQETRMYTVHSLALNCIQSTLVIFKIIEYPS